MVHTCSIELWFWKNLVPKVISFCWLVALGGNDSKSCFINETTTASKGRFEEELEGELERLN